MVANKAFEYMLPVQDVVYRGKRLVEYTTQSLARMIIEGGIKQGQYLIFYMEVGGVDHSVGCFHFSPLFKPDGIAISRIKIFN